jgi:hypothetical protein
MCSVSISSSSIFARNYEFIYQQHVHAYFHVKQGEGRAIPKTGSFVDIVLSYDNQEFHVLTIDSALRLETNAAFVATNDKRQTVDAHLASA